MPAVKTLAPDVGVEPFPGVKLRRLLGRGGLGEVWEADVKGGVSVAVKFIASEREKGGVKEIRAIQAIGKLDHPNLIKIQRVWTQPGYLVCSMELAEGSLLDLLDAHQEELGTQMTPSLTCYYLSQAADALDFLNARNHVIDGQRVAIQHCDVKPSNMLLLGETVKLSDFGLATITSSRLQGHRREGTPDYAAPEVFRGQVSDRSDQYSLAICYHVLRCGRLPFPDVAAFAPSALVNRPEPDLSGLLAAERPAIARALRPAPQERWATCRELMSRLTAAVVGRGRR